MIREILTEWRPAIICMPLNGNNKTHNPKFDGQLDQAVHARVVRVEIAHPENTDQHGEPLKTSYLAIEHKVVSERDANVFLIKERNGKDYLWAKKRFALQFEELNGKTLGRGRIGTPLMTAGIVPEGIMPAFLKEGVSTVEALAYLSDDNLAKFGPGMRTWRDRAQDWVNNQKAAPVALDPGNVRPGYDEAKDQDLADGIRAAINEPKPRGRPKKQPEAAEAA
jgi:hypothetical protein